MTKATSISCNVYVTSNSCPYFVTYHYYIISIVHKSCHRPGGVVGKLLVCDLVESKDQAILTLISQPGVSQTLIGGIKRTNILSGTQTYIYCDCKWDLNFQA